MSNSEKKHGRTDKPASGIDLSKNPEPGQNDQPPLDLRPAGDSQQDELTPAPDTARTIGGGMIAILWVIALAMGTYLAQGWFEKQARSREGTTVSDNQGREALLLRDNRYGQYRVRGSVNGQEVVFLVDTGASGISIPESVARTLGLTRGRPFDVNTANGSVTVYATQLESLSIGPLGRQNLSAHINPGMEGETALLGMSFLRDFEIVHRDGEMTIREP